MAQKPTPEQMVRIIHHMTGNPAMVGLDGKVEVEHQHHSWDVRMHLLMNRYNKQGSHRHYYLYE